MEERLQKGIYKMLGINLSKEEIELVYLLFVQSEFEGGKVPSDVLDNLADPIATTGFGYSDSNSGDFYQVCHLYYVGPYPYEIWMKNDELIENPLEQFIPITP